MSWLEQLPWLVVVFLCLTLGLAPFNPPHIVEKLQMLSRGELVRPLDWFDFVFHAIQAPDGGLQQAFVTGQWKKLLGISLT